MNITRIFTL